MAEDEKRILVGRAVIIRDDKILYLRRSGHFASGRWEFPGGITPEGKLAGSIRETFEETGLKFEPRRRLADLVISHDSEGPFGKANFDIAFFTGVDEGGDVRLSSEHDAYSWVPAWVRPYLNLTRETRMALTELNFFTLNYWLSEDKNLWVPYRD